MAGSLASPLAKLGRAKLHYEALKREIPFAPGLTPCPVIVESDSEGLEYLFRVRDAQDIDDAWLLILGDCLFDLRAALDHLVFQLHVRRLGRLPTTTEADAWRSAFPVYLDDPHPTIKKPWRRIQGLSKAQQTTIKHLQPYNGRNDELHKVRKWLGALNTLNNIDKHRHLHIAWHSVKGTRTPGLYGLFANEGWKMVGLAV